MLASLMRASFRMQRGSLPTAQAQNPQPAQAEGDTRRPDHVRGTLRTHGGARGLPGLLATQLTELRGAAHRRRDALGSGSSSASGPASLENVSAAVQGRDLEDARQLRRMWQGASTFQLWMLAAMPALANPTTTLRRGHSQGQIGVGGGQLTTGLPARSRGWGLSAGIRETKANPSPRGLLGT